MRRWGGECASAVHTGALLLVCATLLSTDKCTSPPSHLPSFAFTTPTVPADGASVREVVQFLLSPEARELRPLLVGASCAMCAFFVISGLCEAVPQLIRSAV